jgi:hypothetical protein
VKHVHKDAVSDVHQLLSLIRARIVDHWQATSGAVSDVERLWKETYGTHAVRTATVQAAIEDLTQVIDHNLIAATAVTYLLATKLARHRGTPDLIAILDEVEADMTRL